jgi:hypothetical protein
LCRRYIHVLEEETPLRYVPRNGAIYTFVFSIFYIDLDRETAFVPGNGTAITIIRAGTGAEPTFFLLAREFCVVLRHYNFAPFFREI